MVFLVHKEGAISAYQPGEIRRGRGIEQIRQPEALKPITTKPVAPAGVGPTAIADEKYRESAQLLAERRRKPVMRARDIMSSPVITLNRDDSIDHARSYFERFRYRHFPILTEDRIVGLLSDRNLLPDASKDKTVSDLMVRSVLTADPETDVPDIARVLLQERIGCIPVVEEKSLVGIITRSDILRAVMNKAPLELWT